ncbi:hypothetical protein J132_11153 [Termitomyces sp. J132]|nr:hypothetical protein J132_11153 [Termitomyces sp. J132]
MGLSRAVTVTTHPLSPRTSPINPPNPQKPPTLCRTSTHAPRLFRLTPTPPRLTLTAPWPTSVPSPQPLTLTLDLPNPRTTPAVPNLRHPSSTQHPGSSDLFRSITTTSGRPAFPNDPINVSAWPNPRLQPTPAHSVELRQAPPPQPTYLEVLRLPVLSQSPGLISVSRSYLSLPVLSCLHFAIILVIVSYLHSNLLLFHIISSDAVSVTLSDRCAQVFINLNNLTNSAITIMNPDTPLPGPNLTLRSVPDSINSK